MLAIGLARLQPFIPRLHIRQRGPIDIQLEITVELRASRDIAKRKGISGDESAPFEIFVEHAEKDGTAGDTLPDQRPVALRFGRSVEIPEYAADEGRLEIGE